MSKQAAKPLTFSPREISAASFLPFVKAHICFTFLRNRYFLRLMKVPRRRSAFLFVLTAKTALACFCLLLGGTDFAEASEWEWISEGGYWSNASNWDPATVPDFSGTANIPSGGVEVNSSAAYQQLDMANGYIVLEGGIFSGSSTNLGAAHGSTVIATVTGGTWNSENFSLAQSGSGTLEIIIGTVNVNGTLSVGGSGGSGSIRVTPVMGYPTPAILSVGQLVSPDQGSVYFDGGILQARADREDFLAGSSGIRYGSGGITVDTNGFNVGGDATIDRSVSGNFTKIGAGTLSILAVSAEEAIIKAGTLDVYNLDAELLSVGKTSGDNGSVTLRSSSYVPTVDVGAAAGSLGSLRLSSGAWLNATEMNLGTSGTGTLLIDGGDLVVASNSFIGGSSTSRATVTMTGGSWSTRRMFISTGSQTINLLGGVLTTTLDIQAGANSTIYLGGGVLSARSIMVSGSNSKMIFDGGTFRSTAAGPSSPLGYSGTTSIRIDDGGAFFDTSQRSISISTHLSGSGALTKIGGNALTLSSSNAYTGGTNLNGGTINLGNAFALGTTGTIAFNGGALRFSSVNKVDYSSRFSQAAGQQYRIDTGGQTVTLAGNLSSSGGTLTKLGAGNLVLSGSNSYSNGTTVSSGTLTAENSHAAGTGTVSVEGGGVFFVSSPGGVSNAITLSGGTYLRSFGPGSNLSGALDATSRFAGGNPDTSASILQGALTASGTTGTSFSSTSSALNDGLRVSDVYSIDGVGNDLFVLELSIAGLEEDAFLAWLDQSNTWINATLGNTGNNASEAQQGFAGSFALFQQGDGLGFDGYGTDLSDYIGAWGTDTSGGSTEVWAVLDHNSSFSIVPEPSTAGLVVLTFCAALMRRRRYYHES